MKSLVCIHCIWILSPLCHEGHYIIPTANSYLTQCIMLPLLPMEFLSTEQLKGLYLKLFEARTVSIFISTLAFPPKTSHHCYHQCNSNGCSNGGSASTEWLLASQSPHPLILLTAGLDNAFVEMPTTGAWPTLALPMVGNFRGGNSQFS